MSAQPEPAGTPARDDPDVSVLVVTYRSADHVEACLDGIGPAVASLSGEVVVIDNDSPDRTPDIVRGRRDATLIEMGANTGFAVANNAGLARARGRHVLLLNPDAQVEPGGIERLVRFLDEHPDAGIVAPRLHYPDGRDQRTARNLPTPAAALFGRRSPLTKLWPTNPWARRYLEPSGANEHEPFPVQWVSGACLLMPRSLLESLGGLDEGFFMHFEDADLCARVAAAGREVWCLPAVRAVHEEGASRGGWPVSQVRYFHTGAYRFYAKHHLTGSRRVLRPLAAAALAARAAVVVARNHLAGLLTRRSEQRVREAGGN